MTLVKVLFYIMAALALGSAVFVAATKNLVRSIFMFFITLLSLAGLYVLALADFVAITQVVVYVGGILVLILFAFMLSGREHLNYLSSIENKFISIRKLPALVLAVAFFIVLVNILVKAAPDQTPWILNAIANKADIQPTTNMTDNIGVNLMTRYLLPFEAISILLMIALVGAAHLARKERTA